MTYHDTEWGRPVLDDRRRFEKVCLEGFQSGLSWLTILRKREGFRAAFADFDAEVVAGFGPADVDGLLQDAAIIRHRGKIESTINNAARFLELVDEFGSFAAYVWGWEPDGPEGEADRERANHRSSPFVTISQTMAPIRTVFSSTIVTDAAILEMSQWGG